MLETNTKNMEVQIGQMAQELHRGPQGSLPSDTVINLKGKEQFHAALLKSGKELSSNSSEKTQCNRKNDDSEGKEPDQEMIEEGKHKDIAKNDQDCEKLDKKNADESKNGTSRRREERKKFLDMWNLKDIPKPPSLFLDNPKKIVFGNK